MPRYQLLLALYLLPFANALTNQTASIVDPVIGRRGSGWSVEAVPDTSSFCGSWTQGIGDFATFNFTGTAVYVNGTVTTNPSSTRATLDGVKILPQSIGGGVFCGGTLYVKDGLDNIENTLVLTFIGPLDNTPPSSPNSLVLLNIIYTVVDPTPTTMTSLGSTSTTIMTSMGPSMVTIPSVAAAATKKSSKGVVAGSAVGGVAGAAALVFLAFLNAHHLQYLLYSLAFSIFGWLLFSRRRLNFSADRSLGPVDITLFLSTHENLIDSAEDAEETLLVWKVFQIGHSRSTFTTTSPCIRATSDGRTKFGFGTVEDVDGQLVKSTAFLEAPSAWNGEEWETFQDQGVSAQNKSGLGISIVLGTYDKSSRGSEFKPFLRINNVELSFNASEGRYLAQTDLYIHAFVTNGYRDGQYGERLVDTVLKDILTERGIKLSDLGPISHWSIRRVNNKLELKLTGLLKKTRTSDVSDSP